MIPPSWHPHRRSEDGELVGYLRPEGALVTPVTVFGYPLSDPTDGGAAADILDRHGLAYLADRWLLQTARGPVSMQIVEATPDRLRLTSVDYGDATYSYGTEVVLDVPVGPALRRG